MLIGSTWPDQSTIVVMIFIVLMLTCLGVHEEEGVVLVLRDVEELQAVLENS